MRLFFLKSYEQRTAWFVDKTAVGGGLSPKPPGARQTNCEPIPTSI